MKLQQLQEARYAGTHPIIEWLHHFMNDEYEIPVAHDSRQFNTVDEAMQIRDLVTSEFGRPHETDTDDWNFTEWIVNHEGRRFHIEVHHGQYGPDSPGIETDIEIICRDTAVRLH